MASTQPKSVHEHAQSPLLQAALDACAVLPAARREALDQTLALLDDLGCDAETQASAAWFALAGHDPEAWEAARKDLPAPLVRLVEGQFAA